MTPSSEVEITEQPEDASGAVGATVTFSVTASGDNLTYQWQKSTTAGGETFEDIEGATSATLSVTVAAADDGFLYRCVATAEDGETTGTSDAAELTVTT